MSISPFFYTMVLRPLLVTVFLPAAVDGDQSLKPSHLHHHEENEEERGASHDDHEDPVWMEDEPLRVKQTAEVAAEKATFEEVAAKKLAEASALAHKEAATKKELVTQAVTKLEDEVKKRRLSMRETVSNALLEQKAASKAKKEMERAEKVLAKAVQSVPAIGKLALEATENAKYDIAESAAVMGEAHTRMLLAKTIAEKSGKEAKYYKELAHALGVQHRVAEEAAKGIEAAKRAAATKKAAKRKASKDLLRDVNFDEVEDPEDEEGVDTILWKKPLISRQVKDRSEADEEEEDDMMLKKIVPAETATEPWAMRPHSITSGLQPEMSRRVQPVPNYAGQLPEAKEKQQLRPISEDAGLWPEVHRNMRPIPNSALLPQEHRRVYSPGRATQKQVRKASKGIALATHAPRLKRKLANVEQN